uniref:Uncharacterized protein n=2 Tax=Arion vulgaris TaxID=1028688 RepID=A0A0B7AEI0_9EUPU
MDARVIVLFCSIILTALCPQVLTEFQDTGNNTSSKLIITSNLTFPYTIRDGTTSMLEFNYSFFEEVDVTYIRDGWVIIASLDNHKIANIPNENKFHIQAISPSGGISISIQGNLPGRTTLYFHGKDQVNKTQISDTEDSSLLNVEKYGQTSWQLFVQREEMPIDIVFNVIIILLVVFTNVGMGAKVDLTVVKSQLRRPIAPAIGLCSQFIFMPLIAFAVVCTLNMDVGIALGLFALGCSPGGSASNAYTFLLDGNVSLSVTMTLISTIASLGLLPMWLFTLGRVVYKEANVRIPFQNIFFSLLGIVVPIIVGLFLQRKFPKIASCFVKAVKYIMILFIIFVMTVGVYANLYIFSLMSGEVLLASALLPYLGFIFGGLAALIGRQDRANIIAIAVETGIQNTGIPIILLRLSLQGPDKDTSIVAPVASAILTPIPLIFGILFVQIRKHIKARKTNKDNSVEEFADNEKESSKDAKEFEDLILTTEDDP